VVTSTDLPGGLGRREITDKVGGWRQLDLSHRSRRPGKARAGPDSHPGPRRCLRRAYTAVNDVVRAMDPDARVLPLEPRTIDGILSAVDTVAAPIGREP